MGPGGHIGLASCEAGAGPGRFSGCPVCSTGGGFIVGHAGDPGCSVCCGGFVVVPSTAADCPGGGVVDEGISGFPSAELGTGVGDAAGICSGGCVGAGPSAPPGFPGSSVNVFDAAPAADPAGSGFSGEGALTAGPPVSPTGHGGTGGLTQLGFSVWSFGFTQHFFDARR